MERNQFEKEIQEKFLKREIKPSKNAWKKLEEELPEKSGKRNSPHNLIWLAAAVVISMFLVFYNPFQQNVQPVSTEETPIVEESKKPIKEEIIKPIEKQVILPDNHVVTENPKNEVETNSPIKNPQKTQEKETVVSISNSVAKSNTPVKKQIQKTGSITNSDEIAAAEAILDEVKKIEAANGEVSEAAIDALIRKAQLKLVISKTPAKTKTSKAALALLEDVEEELDQSFRNRVFDLIKKGYVKVKTAVADRNQ